MKYNCNMMKDLMPLCMDGAASEASEKAVTEHLADCLDCQNYYEQISKGTDIGDPSETITEERLQYKIIAKKLTIYRLIRRSFVSFFCMIVILSALWYSGGYRITSLAAAKTSKWVNQESILVADYDWGEWHFYFYENASMYNSVITKKRNILWQDHNNNFWTEKTSNGLNMAGFINFYTDFKGGIIILPVQNNTSEVLTVEIIVGGQIIKKEIKEEAAELFVKEFMEQDEYTDNKIQGKAYSTDGTLSYILKNEWSTISGQMQYYWEATN